MNKIAKNSLIIALILLLLGIVLLGVGYAVGGTNYRIDMAEGFKKSFINEEALKIEYNISTSDIRDYVDVFFDDWDNESYMIYAGRMEKTEVASMAEIKSVVLKADACNMLIKTSTDDFYYMESTVNEEFRCYVKNDVLYFEGINYIQTKGNVTGDLILYVPEDTSLDTLEIQARACAMEVKEIEADEIRCELGAGQIVFDDIEADQIVVQLGAGEVNMYDVIAEKMYAEVGAGEFTLDQGEIDKVEVSVGMGNATLTSLMVDNLTTACAMGNITVGINGNEDDYDYSAQCVAGNVSIGRTGGVVIGTSGRNADREKMISADCAMGNIEIYFSE